MKKLIILLAIITPLAGSAQWSVVPSIALGSTRLHNDFNNENTTNSELGYDASATVRYSFNDFFVSTGVGYQSLSVSSDFRQANGSGMAKFSYENVYFPLSVGFLYKRIAVYPIVEVGAHIGITTGSVNRLNVNYSTLEATESNEGTNSLVLSYFFDLGAGYSFSKHLGAELKFHFSDSGNLDNGNPFIPGDQVTTWRLLGGQLSFVYTF